MNFDLVLDELGDFGKFQVLIYILYCLPTFFGAAMNLSYVFTTAEPKYRCHIPGCDNSTSRFSEPWLGLAIPEENNSTEEYAPKQCTMYRRTPSARNDTCGPWDFGNQETTCDRWVFDDQEWTIVSEWNLTCPDNKWKLSLIGTVNFSGVFVGALVFGILSDRFGRKKILVLCVLVNAIVGLALTLCTSYISFIVLIFISAFWNSTVFPGAFVLGMELVGPKHRAMAGNVVNYFFALGEAALGGVAWWLGDWRMIQWVVCGPALIFISYIWIIPESVRWLISKNHYEEAHHIVQRAAKMNGVVLSQNALSLKQIHAEENTETHASTAELVKSKDSGLIGVFRSRRLSIRFINLAFNWIVNIFVYYGLSINSTSLGGNKYLNFILVGLAEIPGYTIAWIMLDRLGRRRSLAGSLLLSGVACIGAAFIPPDMNWAVILLFLLGKIFITSSFAIVYVITTELFPTSMRQSVLGSLSMLGRIGSIVAPQVALLSFYMDALPLLTFGAPAFLAGLLTFFLPETLGSKLPESVEEAETL